MKLHGLEQRFPQVHYVPQAQPDLMTRLPTYSFPDDFPHNQFSFLEAFKENDRFIAFGFNSMYNLVYVQIKATESILTLDDTEREAFRCAASLTHFLDLFVLLIQLETHLVDNPDYLPAADRLEEAVHRAGGAAYQPFVELVFPKRVV